jgi:hypothetical protein
MKHSIIFKFFTFILAASCLNTSATNIYIENHYGATIKFKKGSPNSNAPEIKVDNQKRVFVGTSSTISQLSIRTAGTGSSLVSYFTSMDPQLVEIQSKENNTGTKDKNAIILIKPSRSYQNWNIEVYWETSNPHIKSFEKDFNEFEPALKQEEARKKEAEEMKAFAEQTRRFAEEQKKIKPVTPSQDFFFTEQMLTEIMQGALGEDYAQKARAINDYDYTNATKKGLQNLRTHLLKRIDETFKQTYTKESRREKKWISPGLATEQELKDNIDMLYRSLQRYKAQNI